MSRNYDRKHYDKENSFDTSKPAGVHHQPGLLSNGQLRRKIDQNLALVEKDPSNLLEEGEPYYKQGQPTKRENARRRGFDLKVSNIDSINDKITGLLSMINKDRNRDRVEEEILGIEKERREVSRSPNFAVGKKTKDENWTNTHDKVYSRDQRNISPFRQDPDKMRVKYQQEEMMRKQYPRQEPKKYVEESFIEEPSRHRGNMRTSQWWNQILKDHQQQKEVGRKHNNQPSRKGGLEEGKMKIDDMLEQRRKQRKTRKQMEKDKSVDMLPQHRSAINKRHSYLDLGNISSNKNDSPIVKVSEDCFFDKVVEPFREDSILPSKRHSREASPKKQYSRFQQLSYLGQDEERQTKITSTAKIIDDQLVRMKSQIKGSQIGKRKREIVQPQSQQNKTKEHVIRIAQNISAQVQFDSHLKPARESFERLNDSDKWGNLEDKLTRKGVRIDKSTLKELVRIGADEHNPFGSEKISIDIQELSELMAAAEKNWQNCVISCASSRSLKCESFEISDLDLNNKGYLSLEDLVCFVNLYANTFYRNRDLALVFRRLQLKEASLQNGGISYQTFLEALTV